MRIGIPLYSKDVHLSGVEYYSLGPVRCLAEHLPGNQYVVLTNRPDCVRSCLGTLRSVEVQRAYYGSNRTLRRLWEHLRLPSLAERLRLDVLHCPCYIGPMFPGSVSRVVTVHDTLALDHPEWCQRLNVAYYRLAMERSIACAERQRASTLWPVELRFYFWRRL